MTIGIKAAKYANYIQRKYLLSILSYLEIIVDAHVGYLIKFHNMIVIET